MGMQMDEAAGGYRATPKQFLVDLLGTVLRPPV